MYLGHLDLILYLLTSCFSELFHDLVSPTHYSFSDSTSTADPADRSLVSLTEPLSTHRVANHVDISVRSATSLGAVIDTRSMARILAEHSM